MKQIVLFMAVFQFCSITYGQDVAFDSLNLSNEKKTIAKDLFYRGKYISAAKQYAQALKIIPKRHLEGKIELTCLVGRAFQNARSFDSALHYYQKADKLCNDSTSSRIKSIKYALRASCFHANEQIDSTMRNALKALKYASLSKDRKQISHTNGALGVFFLIQKNIGKAESYLQKAYDIALKTGDSIIIEFTRVYIGQLEMEKKQYDSAEFKLKKALSFFERKTYRRGVFLTKGLLSKMYLSQGKLEESVKFGFESLSIIKEMEFDTKDYIQSLIEGVNSVVELPNREDISGSLKVDAAKILIEDGFKQVDNIQAPLDYNKAMVKYYKENVKATNPEDSPIDSQIKLNEKLHRTIELQDSIHRKSMESRYAELETKFKTQEKEKENLKLEQEATERELQLERESKQKWLFGIGLLTAIISLAIFAFYYRRNRRQKRIIEYLQKEMHHRVKNNLSIINAFIDNAGNGSNEAEVEDKLLDLQNRIDSIYHIHEQLHQNKDISNLKMKSYVETLARNVQQSFFKEDVAIAINIDSTLQVDADKSFPVGLIINEFLTNSFKHAFGNQTEGKIDIDLKRDDKFYYLLLSDNGKGLPSGFDINKLKSYGLKVMKLLVKQIKGAFLFENKDGVTLTVKFPKS